MTSHSKMIRLAGLAVALLAIVASIGLLQGSKSASAGALAVSVNSDFFSPSDVPVATGVTVGDTVTWTVASGSHNVTSSTIPAGAASFGTGIVMGPTFSYTFTTAGTYYYYCSLHASAADATPAGWNPGKMVGRIVVSPAVTDTTGPVTSSVAASPNPTNGAAAAVVTASVSDSTTGNSNIAAAEYSVGATAAAAGSGTAMSAQDGSFNAATETVTGNVSITAAVGTTQTVWVRGRDAAGNWGSPVSVAISVTPVPAGSVTASVTISAGSLGNTTSPVSLGSVQLTGANLTASGTPSKWTAVDARGTGAGWNVTISSSAFTSSGGGTIAASEFKIQLPQGAITTVSGNTAPLTGAASATPLNASIKLLSAALNTGMGTYDYQPNFQLAIPASATPGSYTANLTVSINSGP